MVKIFKNTKRSLEVYHLQPNDKNKSFFAEVNGKQPEF